MIPIQQMKALVRDTTGFSEQFLGNLLKSILFPSAFFDHPIPVLGVCFAAGSESLQLACEFAGTFLGLGTICFRMDLMTAVKWEEISRLLVPPQADLSKVAFLLRDLDHAPSALQEAVASTLNAFEGVPWFVTVSDHRRLIPALKTPFVTYLGLSRDNRMQVLVQSGQTLLVDRGSYRPATRN